MEREEVKAIINSQISRANRLSAADHLIDNSNSNLDSIRQQVLILDSYFRNELLTQVDKLK